MKRWVALGLLVAMTLLPACWPAAALALHAAGRAPAMGWATVAGTGYRIGVPEGWSVTVQPDPAQAVLEATNADGSQTMLAFVQEQPGWDLVRWQKALEKASRSNSVSDIAELWIGERCFIGYTLAWEGIAAWAAATQVSEGLFVTLEFRVQLPGEPRADFIPSPDCFLATMQVEP